MAVTSAASAHPLAHYRAEFPIFQHRIYLNSCSLGALSTRSRRRVSEFLGEWDARGAAAWYDVWWQALAELRGEYATLIGAMPSEIALHASVSTATAVVASALDYTGRPKVVTTALVATSHVFFTTGAIQDIRAVAEAAHAKGALCFVDAYQSVGQIPVDVRVAGVDFLCAGGLKWLLGGPGIVFLYVRHELARRLTPTVTGWFANERQFEFDPRALAWHGDARRFEQGTPALAAVYAQLGGLEVIREIGVHRIRSIVSELTDDLISRARAAELRPRVAPDRADRADRAAIVMIPVADPPAAVRRLADAGVVADARPGHVRVSPYFYNIIDDHAATIEILRV